MARHGSTARGCAHKTRRLAASCVLAALAAAARADDFAVHSPYLNLTATEVELLDSANDGSGEERGSSGAAEFSVAHTFTDWWRPEIALAQLELTPGHGARLAGYELENTFQFTQPGEYWIDVGLLASYQHSLRTHDAVEFGPLLEKTLGRFSHTVNLVWERRFGAGGERELRCSYLGTYALSFALRPGVEALARRGGDGEHTLQAGPVVAGEWHIAGSNSNVEYTFGVMFGLDAAAPRHTWLAQIEYETF